MKYSNQPLSKIQTMKYRIISKTQYGLMTTYYAQWKLFGLFWINLPYTSVGGIGKWEDGGENPSTIQKLVENYIEMHINGHFSETHKVIKTYE